MIQVGTDKVSNKSSWPCTKLGKNTIILSYIVSVRRKKKNGLYGQAGTPIPEKLWLTWANVQRGCTLHMGEEKRGPHTHREFDV